MRRIALIDYGSGNLASAEKALRQAGAAGPRAYEIVTTDDPDVIARVDAVVLPGVGAFAACMAALRAKAGVVDALSEACQRRGAAFLGICVGMQLLADRGEEFGSTPGLGWIEGEVKRLKPADIRCKLPHVGWNGIDPPLGRQAFGAPLFHDLAPGEPMYFTHAFALSPADPAVVAARTDHGGAFVSAVVKDNLAGVQFHPEKSQGAGARLLGNFLEWRP
jgi:glutamine amidotransferase